MRRINNEITAGEQKSIPAVTLCQFIIQNLSSGKDIANLNNGFSIDKLSISDTMAAFISYPQDKTDHTFSVYVNRPGLSFGYFFRGGGDIVEVDDYIAEFVVEGNNERAFISMNTQNIVRLEVDDGNGIQVIDIDSGKPFAIVLPLNVGNICFYDTNGNVVEYLRQQL